MTYKWVGQTWRRRESGRGSEARRSHDTNDGSPLRVDSSSAGVSMPVPQPPICSTPARAFAPLPHTFVTANLIPLKSDSKYELCGEGDGDGDGDGGARGDKGFRQSLEHLACVLRGARNLTTLLGYEGARSVEGEGGICGGRAGAWSRRRRVRTRGEYRLGFSQFAFERGLDMGRVDAESITRVIWERART